MIFTRPKRFITKNDGKLSNYFKKLLKLAEIIISNIKTNTTAKKTSSKFKPKNLLKLVTLAKCIYFEAKISLTTNAENVLMKYAPKIRHYKAKCLIFKV